MNIKEIMKEKNVRSVDIAKFMEVDNSTVHRWLKVDPEYVLKLITENNIEPHNKNKLKKIKLEQILIEINRRGFDVSLTPIIKYIKGE